MVRLSVNGKNYEIDVDPSTPLLWAYWPVSSVARAGQQSGYEM